MHSADEEDKEQAGYGEDSSMSFNGQTRSTTWHHGKLPALALLASLWASSTFQAASSTLQTAPPDVAAGWNTSVGSVTDRHNAA